MALITHGDHDATPNGKEAGMAAALNGREPAKAGKHNGGSEAELNSKRQHARDADAQRRRARTLAKQQQAAERIAAATSQLSAGIAEATEASEELRRSMDQIAAGAQEASSASQQSLRGIQESAKAITSTKENAERSKSTTDSLQNLVAQVSVEIGSTVASVSTASERQAAAAGQVSELKDQAANIGDIVKAVGRIADQTNLLALNAAIEAARAGQHGRGFAVVADEVRNLAETSENSSREISDLVTRIQQEVGVIAEGINRSSEQALSEVEKGKTISKTLDDIRTGMADITQGATDILSAADQAETAAKEAQSGSEAIAAAAEEQSSACEEALRMVDEQTSALSQSEQAAQSLSDTADELKNSSDVAKSAEEVASASEELSSGVQEINRASAQIMSAIEQISKGAEQQSAAAEQSSAAVAQIQRIAEIARERTAVALESGTAMSEQIGENKANVLALVDGITNALEEAKASREQINALEEVSSRIDKIVDAISMVSVQTNMLAVSGGIEAARAGEFGKGFAVVATDIRNLARDSSENAGRIKDLVKAIQAQIATVRRDLEDIATSALAEVEKTTVIVTNLDAVSKDMSIVLEGSQEISTAAEELGRYLEEVKTGVEQVAASAEEANSASAEAAGASRQQSQGAEELAAAIEEIASLADELQS